MDVGKIQLDIQEHYILANLKSRIGQYLLMWLAAIIIGLILSHLPFEQPATSFQDVQSLSRSFLSISVVTITFAIPTCMRTIFSAYEQYYSTKIREVLLARFPVVLLALSAFTSLIVSLAAIAGISAYLPFPPAFAFYIGLFWCLVCVIYLFVAIEKLIYFVVRAPFAVLDKLGYHIDATDAAADKDKYAEFRRELSSMNDIAATILARSTGRDDAITRTLDFFRATHARYASATEGEDAQTRKRRLNACRAVDHEIVRIFREACGTRNEQACRKVVKTYCAMIADGASAGVSSGYFQDMLGQLERMQSYADSSKVEEIEYLASVGWFFILAREAGRDNLSAEKRASVARRLSASLKTETIEEADNVITKFLRTAADSDLEYDISSFSPMWQMMLDRGVFVYLVWLLDTMPEGCERHLENIRRYSTVNTEAYRNVLPDSIGRVRGLFLAQSLESPAGGLPSSDETVMMMGMNWEETSAHTIAMLCVLRYANIKVSSLGKMGHVGQRLLNEITHMGELLEDGGGEQTPEGLSERLRLGLLVDDSLEKQVDAACELGDEQTVRR